MVKTIRKTVVALLAGYHKTLSLLLPSACRFHPSCSVYTSNAIQKYGIVKGAILGLRRLGRCHPWNAGGYDPVR